MGCFSSTLSLEQQDAITSEMGENPELSSNELKKSLGRNKNITSLLQHHVPISNVVRLITGFLDQKYFLRDDLDIYHYLVQHKIHSRHDLHLIRPFLKNPTAADFNRIRDIFLLPGFIYYRGNHWTIKFPFSELFAGVENNILTELRVLFSRLNLNLDTNFDPSCPPCRDMFFSKICRYCSWTLINSNHIVKKFETDSDGHESMLRTVTSRVICPNCEINKMRTNVDRIEQPYDPQTDSWKWSLYDLTHGDVIIDER